VDGAGATCACMLCLAVMLTSDSLLVKWFSIFWDDACEGYISGIYSFKYEGGYCLYHCITLIIDAVSISETSVIFYKTAWCNSPEDSPLRFLKFVGLWRGGEVTWEVC
jgi:hypothetical protein